MVAMGRCVICGQETPLDDLSSQSKEEGLVCLRCYGNRTGTLTAMPESLRRAVDAVLAAAPAGMCTEHAPSSATMCPPQTGAAAITSGEARLPVRFRVPTAALAPATTKQTRRRLIRELLKLVPTAIVLVVIIWGLVSTALF
jgi:hypothetical protein